MDKDKSFDETIVRERLSRNPFSDNFLEHVEKIYSDLVSTPHFNDEHVIFEDSGVSFFHKETKEELSWLIVIILRIYINQLGFARLFGTH